MRPMNKAPTLPTKSRSLPNTPSKSAAKRWHPARTPTGNTPPDNYPLLSPFPFPFSSDESSESGYSSSYESDSSRDEESFGLPLYAEERFRITNSQLFQKAKLHAPELFIQFYENVLWTVRKLERTPAPWSHAKLPGHCEARRDNPEEGFSPRTFSYYVVCFISAPVGSEAKAQDWVTLAGEVGAEQGHGFHGAFYNAREFQLDKVKAYPPLYFQVIEQEQEQEQEQQA